MTRGVECPPLTTPSLPTSLSGSPGVDPYRPGSNPESKEPEVLGVRIGGGLEEGRRPVQVRELKCLLLWFRVDGVTSVSETGDTPLFIEVTSMTVSRPQVDPEGDKRLFPTNGRC